LRDLHLTTPAASIDASGKTFNYDAKNKQIEVKNASNQSLGQYFYNGDGKRVKKIVLTTGETTIFIMIRQANW